MTRRVTLCTAILLALMVAAVPAFSQNRLIVRQELKHDVSPAVRDLPDVQISQAGIRMPLLNPSRILGAAANPQLKDPLVSDADLARQPQPDLQATVLLKFDGLHNACCFPPDTNASVGSTQLVETVNLQWEIFDKTTGAVVQGPRSLASIFSGFGGMCQNGPGFSDPVVLWDKAAQRWFITFITYNSQLASTQCFAVSTSTDATGTYNRYGFSFGTKLADYGKFGVWPDAYYANYNMFAPGFIGAQACAYDRSKMLAGQAATSVCFQRGQADYALLPSDLDGNTAPPAGSPNYFVELDGSSFTQLDLFKFHVDFVNPNNSTFSGPTKFTIASWRQLCPGTRSCVPQPSPGERVDSLGDRLMFRNAYRNFGDHEALVLSHTVDKGSGVAGVRWYEVRSPGSTPAVFQQGTVSKTPYLWMPSIGMDKMGDIAVGFSVSSTTVFPSVKITGRVPSDPAGTMQKPKSVATGAGSQTGGGSRWGDYSSMSVDSSDDCTMWYAQEYYKSNGGTWFTRLAKFKFNACN